MAGLDGYESARYTDDKIIAYGIISVFRVFNISAEELQIAFSSGRLLFIIGTFSNTTRHPDTMT